MDSSSLVRCCWVMAWISLCCEFSNVILYKGVTLYFRMFPFMSSPYLLEVNSSYSLLSTPCSSVKESPSLGENSQLVGPVWGRSWHGAVPLAIWTEARQAQLYRSLPHCFGCRDSQTIAVIFPECLLVSQIHAVCWLISAGLNLKCDLRLILFSSFFNPVLVFAVASGNTIMFYS